MQAQLDPKQILARVAAETKLEAQPRTVRRAGHLAPGWVKQAREALGPNVRAKPETTAAPD